MSGDFKKFLSTLIIYILALECFLGVMMTVWHACAYTKNEIRNSAPEHIVAAWNWFTTWCFILCFAWKFISKHNDFSTMVECQASKQKSLQNKLVEDGNVWAEPLEFRDSAVLYFSVILAWFIFESYSFFKCLFCRGRASSVNIA